MLRGLVWPVLFHAYRKPVKPVGAFLGRRECSDMSRQEKTRQRQENGVSVASRPRPACANRSKRRFRPLQGESRSGGRRFGVPCERSLRRADGASVPARTLYAVPAYSFRRRRQRQMRGGGKAVCPSHTGLYFRGARSRNRCSGSRPRVFLSFTKNRRKARFPAPLTAAGLQPVCCCCAVVAVVVVVIVVVG